ncbi:MAG: 2OG-Fe(II) oxygenase [Myxococcaceae bacterium]|nr:2OG-Fe(II) oxygenase [Myxococcaceae bacterium]
MKHAPTPARPERSAKRRVEGVTEVEQLGERGFFVRDAFAPADLIEAALKHAHTQPLTPAGIQRGAIKSPDVRTDLTAWLDDAPLTPAFEALRQELNHTAYLGLTRFDLQLARYEPGARYVRHRDAFPGSDNRRVTAIVYLNVAWRKEHGGLLRLHVEPPVDVEPVLNRLVVFLSDRVEHEVLPAHAPRLALTAWFYA